MKSPRHYLLTIALLVLAVTDTGLLAQVSFTPGSDGSDGDLIFSAPPSARRHSTAAFFPGLGKSFLFGGQQRNSVELGGTYSWNGSEWTEETPPSEPGPRSRAGYAFDSARNVLVTFGGFSIKANDEIAETWEFDGTTWARIETFSNPPKRRGAALVFDPVRNVVVMFGGVDGSQELNDTWEYNGTNWTLKSFGNQPPQISYPTMVYDTARSETVLFGGSTNSGGSGALAQTWTYSGFSWTQKDPGAIPPARWLAAACYDSSRQRLRMFGGEDVKGAPLNDFWEWTGSDWQRVSESVTSSQRPSPRQGSVIVHDTVRDKYLLYGGDSDAADLDDTWLFDPATANWSAPQNVQTTAEIDLLENGFTKRAFYYRDVYVPAGTTVRFRNGKPNQPVVWLASGSVTVDGVIDLNGENGGPDDIGYGMAANGGPGGFPGGLGGTQQNISGSFAGTAGLGPGGGGPGISDSDPAGQGSYGSRGTATEDGSVYGSPDLYPLVGGSGGGGGGSSQTDNAGAGGGGGGAILIAADTIDVNGSILAPGGSGNAAAGNAGSGSGGAIKLICRRLTGNGTINAGSRGRIKIETLQYEYAGTTSPAPNSSPPRAINVAAELDTEPEIRIVRVSGEEVIDNPDNPNAPQAAVSTDNATPTTIEIETNNVPAGTIVSLRITSFGSTRGQVTIVTSTPVAIGNDGIGTATATAILPGGVGSVQAFANYLRP